MKSDQRLKLKKFKTSLEKAEAKLAERKLQREVLEVKQSLLQSNSKIEDTLNIVRDLLEDGVKLEQNVEAPDLSGVAEAIKSISFPEQKAPVVNVKSPIVNVAPTVTVVNEDIYSRYKRADSATDDSITYHGFIDADGNWFIQRESGTDTVARSRYAVGKGNFTQQWPKRASLEYKLLSEVNIV